MVKYCCLNCNKEFYKKSNYINHTENRKYPCGINLINIANTPENIIDTPDKNFIKNKQEDIITINKEFKCIYCELNFTRKDSLRKHLNGRCKIIKEKNINQKECNKENNNLVNIDELDIDNKTKIILNILMNQNKKLIEDMKEEMNQIKEENKVMKEKINKIDKTKITKIINNTNNTQNNTLNNTVNNTNIILAHGKEDLSKIELEAIMCCMSTIKHKEIIPNITKHVYLNDSKPENKNFCVLDIARNKCKYYNGEKWMIGKTTDKIGKIFDNVHNMLTDPFEKENITKTIEFIKKNQKKFNEKWIKISNVYLKSLYDDDDKENIENKLKVLDEIKLIFFNHKDEILQINSI